jgi:hypothetical protein
MTGPLTPAPHLVPELSISGEANRVKVVLEDWGSGEGWTVKIMANLAHLWEELKVTSDKGRILIVYQGEEPRGSFADSDELHRVDRNWTLAIVRGHGKNSMMSDDVGNAVAFYDAVEGIREAVRCAALSQEFPVHYKGMTPMSNIAPTQQASTYMDGMLMEYSTSHDLPAIGIQSPNQPTL